MNQIWIICPILFALIIVSRLWKPQLQLQDVQLASAPFLAQFWYVWYFLRFLLNKPKIVADDALVCGALVRAETRRAVKVAKSGALAPKWRFWNSLWRQKKFGALWRIKKNLQKKLFPVNIFKNHWEILDLGYLEKIIR